MEKEVNQNFEFLYSLAKWELTKSDKYVIRIIWNRYRKLYKQQQQGKLKLGEYAKRRRYYIDLVYDILGYYSFPMGYEKEENK